MQRETEGSLLSPKASWWGLRKDSLLPPPGVTEESWISVHCEVCDWPNYAGHPSPCPV